MANQLRMAEQQTIVTLAQRGWSQRRIADQLGVNRETVARYVRLARAAQANPAISITGSEAPASGSHVPVRAPPNSNPAISITGSDPPAAGAAIPSLSSRTGRRSCCEPLRAVILGQLERGLTARRIWQDLTAEHGFTDSYQSVQRFVKRLGAATPLPFRRMECEPGEEAQIDFGRGAPIIVRADAGRPAAGAPLMAPADATTSAPPGSSGNMAYATSRVAGKPRRRTTHLFRIVLSCSRKAYSEVVYRQTADRRVAGIHHRACCPASFPSGEHREVSR